MLEDGDFDWYSDRTASPRPLSRHSSGEDGARGGTGGGLEETLDEHQQPSERVARRRTPMSRWPFVRLPWGRVAVVLAWLVGLAVQWWLMDLAYQLVDLVLSLFELWAELARLHLDVVKT